MHRRRRRCWRCARREHPPASRCQANFFRDNNSDDVHLLAALDTHPDLLMLGGGLPIILNGECVGAVGVSGASQAEDIACAEAALGTLGANAD